MCIYYVGCVHTCHSPCLGVIGQFVGSLLSWFYVSSRHQAQTVRLIASESGCLSLLSQITSPRRKGLSFCFRCICFYFMRIVKCLHVCTHTTCMPCDWRVQKRAPDTLELGAGNPTQVLTSELWLQPQKDLYYCLMGGGDVHMYTAGCLEHGTQVWNSSSIFHAHLCLKVILCAMSGGPAFDRHSPQHEVRYETSHSDLMSAFRSCQILEHFGL